MGGLRINFISTLLLSMIIIGSPVNAYSWECEVTLDGPNSIKVGQQITLSALGAPEGGSYSWSNTPNLVPYGAIAVLTGFVPSNSDYIWVTVTYTSPKGKKCSDRKGIWVCKCYVEISGPTEVKTDEMITLTAQGEISGGSYEWSAVPGLVPNGSTAQFTGQFPGDVAIKVTYTNPDGKTCYDIHTITVKEECSVTILGPSVVGIGNNITLAASGTPTGGIYIWTPMQGLVPGTSSATFFGKSSGNVTIEVAYTSPDGGGPCIDTHIVTVFGVESITGPSCVKSGSTLTKADFTIVTNPPGFEDLVTVSPLTFSTLYQTEDVTVTAYSGTSMASDEKSTTITVINNNVKTGTDVSFDIPNYISKPLEALGLADKVVISVKNSYERFMECCSPEAASSAKGNTSVGLNVAAGPFAIIGIPLPPKAKKWVSADLVNITLSGEGDVAIDGSSNACEDTTQWSGGGDLTAGVKVGGDLTLKVPYVIVLKKEIKGSISITEKLGIDLSNLKITTNWGGLTGLVSGEIQLFGRRTIKFDASKTYFAQDDLLPVTIPLPSL